MKEKFSWNKFKKIFTLTSIVEWIKSIKEMIDIRKFIIYLLIFGSIYIYLDFKHKMNTPIEINLAFDKEFKLDLNGEYLEKPKYSSNLFIKDDKTNEIIKVIKAKDIPNLKKKLKPFAVELEPFGVVAYCGYSSSDIHENIEAGVGVSILRFYRARAELLGTNRGAYVGISYKLDQLGLENSALGLAYGRGWEKADDRALAYFRIEF